MTSITEKANEVINQAKEKLQGKNEQASESEMPKRDTSGECEGECRDRVKELKEEQQQAIDKEGMPGSTEETATAESAKSRDNPPGEMGGHV